MPCRQPDPVPPLSFASNFPTDTDYFSVAMAEHNYARWRAELPAARFDELEAGDRAKVLARAQKLKNGRASLDTAGVAEVSFLETRHPWLARMAEAVARLFASGQAA